MKQEQLYKMIPSLISYEENQKLLMNNILYKLSELDQKHKLLYVNYIGNNNIKQLFDTLINIIINRPDLITNLTEIKNIESSTIYNMVYHLILSIYKQININIKSVEQNYIIDICKRLLSIYIDFTKLNMKTCSHFVCNKINNINYADLTNDQVVMSFNGRIYEHVIIGVISEMYHLPKLSLDNQGFDAMIITSPMNNSKRIIIEIKYMTLNNHSLCDRFNKLRKNTKAQNTKAVQLNIIEPDDIKILISNINLSSDSINSAFDKVFCIPILPNGSIICVEEFKNLISYIQGIIDDEYKKYYNSTNN